MDAYRIYAIEYANRQASASELFLRSQDEEPVTMSYYVWAITGPNRTVVVDTGFTQEKALCRGRDMNMDPGEGLKRIGVDPVSVDHVIVTHFHWDHLGGMKLFPKATFYAQQKEMAFWTGRYAHFPIFRDVIEADDIVSAVQLRLAGRLVLFDGYGEILPGIAVHPVGGHTPGMQIVEVTTSQGIAVIASDAVKTYRNLAENVPDPFLHDIPEMLDGYELVRQHASNERIIFPGHDPEVLRGFTPAGPGTVVLD